MKILIVLFLFSFVIFFESCQKDETLPEPAPVNPCDTTFIEDYTTDTIFPSDYLMCYPGSWWEYTNGRVDSATGWSNVQLYNLTNQQDCAIVTEDLYILPILKNTQSGYYNYVYNNSFILPSKIYPDTEFRAVVGDIEGAITFEGNSEIMGQGNDSYQFRTVIKNKENLDSLWVNGIMYYHIIYMETSTKTYYYHWGDGPVSKIHCFYAKDVGLIRAINESMYGYMDTMDIATYHIEPY